jgi:hypothetical protein
LLDNLTQTVSLNKAEEVLAQMSKYRWLFNVRLSK